jgi:hypothetical protein
LLHRGAKVDSHKTFQEHCKWRFGFRRHPLLPVRFTFFLDILGFLDEALSSEFGMLN